MLSESEYFKAKKYFDELNQCYDELHKLWENNADHHLVKQRELYYKHSAEITAAIPIEFGCSPKELKTQVKDYEKLREIYPPHHEPERGRRPLTESYESRSSLSDLFDGQLKQYYTPVHSPEPGRRFGDIFDNPQESGQKQPVLNHEQEQPPEHQSFGDLFGDMQPLSPGQDRQREREQ
jgi:hypothetical protein